MKIAFAVLLVVHGAIHMLGVAKAFGLAALPQLRLPIGKPVGVLWGVAALAFIAAAVVLFAAPSHWWMPALAALVVSQTVIVLSWSDAKVGTVANVIVLIPLALSMLDLRPSSLRSMYRSAVERRVAEHHASATLTEQDLASLPPIVATYVRRSGAVGRPRVHNFRARFHGEIRSSPDADWMPFDGEQYNFIDRPARIFFMRASKLGLPFDGLHVFDGSATMQVRIVGLFQVVDARGPEMDQSETVTFFNDLCILAPGALPAARARWEEIDEHAVRAHFTHGSHTIAARLSFDDSGDLIDFVSDDRFLSADGSSYRRIPWSTPLTGYRDFGAARLGGDGRGVWLAPEGRIEYLRYRLDSIDVNVAR